MILRRSFFLMEKLTVIHHMLQSYVQPHLHSRVFAQDKQAGITGHHAYSISSYNYSDYTEWLLGTFYPQVGEETSPSHPVFTCTKRILLS